MKAIFRCASVRPIGDGSTEVVELEPSGSYENGDWSEYGYPSGRLSLTVTARKALGTFKVGATYAVKIEEA